MRLTILGAIAGATLCAAFADQPQSEDKFTQQALELHQRILSLDAHVDIPDNFATAAADPGKNGDMQWDLPKLQRSGQSGAVLAVFVSQTPRTPENYRLAEAQGFAKLDAIHRMADQYPRQLGIAYSAADLERLRKQGRRIAVIGMLNGFSLGARAQHLDEYYRRGLRQLGFTHAGNNDLADSSRPSRRNGDNGPEHGGLSALGRTLVERLNRKGIIVDVSQLTVAALEQAVAASEAPVIASHSAVRELVDEARNLTPGEMQLIAESGGVIHIVAFGTYLKKSPVDFVAELMLIQARHDLKDAKEVANMPAERRAAYEADIATLRSRIPVVTLGQYIDVVEQAINNVGIDHVGLSSDFGHGGGVAGWMNAGETANVTAELLRRGYSERDIAKLWGLNWLRVFRQVEARARELSVN